ncbi:MAG TPA: DUF3999 family protein [Cytophagales bacterium]|nr:DUF3999 family protein [Cytophagales bacterium]
MKLMCRISLTCVLVLAYFHSFAQIEKFDYKRKLQGTKDHWHKIVLPNDIFGKVSSDLSDIRIFGISESNDTLEVPYILKISSEEKYDKVVDFRTINKSRGDEGYFFTFELPVRSTINQLNLNFKRQNFDWRIRLEGSQDQREWYTVIEDYRILSIKNQDVAYEYTQVKMPSSQYQYFKLFIETNEEPELLSAKILLNEREEGILESFKVKDVNYQEDRKSKQTKVNIILNSPSPVSIIRLNIQDTFDYYRPVSIEYISDSFKTQKGWRYNYLPLASGILNSIEKNEIKFNSIILQKLRITIDNQDNQPLSVEDIEVEGYKHELIARFIKQGDYFLTYGNQNIGKPHYDIVNFEDKISEELTALVLEEEQLIEKEKLTKTEPLFKNKIWLWLVMSVAILALGLFSLKMMKKG